MLKMTLKSNHDFDLGKCSIGKLKFVLASNLALSKSLLLVKPFCRSLTVFALFVVSCCSDGGC